jgi:hypothetical protein
MPHRRKYNCSLSFQDHKEAVSARDSPSEALVIHADLSLEVLASEPGSLFGAGPALGNVEATYSAPVQRSGRGETLLRNANDRGHCGNALVDNLNRRTLSLASFR